MASTYSNLKIQLMATGENNTTWGTVTNVNLGTAIEEAIVGSADVTFASANVTLTLTDTNSTQTARNLRLRCTGTTGGATRNLVVPSIEKPYIVQNDCADSITVKTAAGSGVTVPAGKTTWVYCDATNVVSVVSHLASLTLDTALPVSSGGTGTNTLTSGYLVKGNGTSAVTASVIYDTGTNVGIGTSSPSSLLSVSGANDVSALTSSTTTCGLLITDSAATIRVGTRSGSAIFDVASAERMRITTSGDVGVGTNSPGAKLDVSGASATDIFHVTRGTTYFTVGVTDGVQAEINAFQAGVGVRKLSVQGAGGDTTFGGNVGVGTSSPSSKLDVSGTVTATSFSGAGTGLTGTASGLSVGGSAASASSLSTSNFSIVESGGYLYIKYGNTNIARIDSSGNMVATGNVTAYGSI